MLNISTKTFIFYNSFKNSDIRLDRFLCSKSDLRLSRAQIQNLIRSGAVTVNDEVKKPSHLLRPGDRITLTLTPSPGLSDANKKVKLDILYEDNSIIVVDKPPGLIVHPTGDPSRTTLVQQLLNRGISLSASEDKKRPGIVHRLDKDTSGIMVVAKNSYAHDFLSTQFKQRQIKKNYLAIVHGRLGEKKGTIDLPIYRHATKRKEMAISLLRGRPSITEWIELKGFSQNFSLVGIHLKTGRTHQIRVHMAYIGRPVVGDLVYGYGKRWWNKQPAKIREIREMVNRQMLHAELLGFFHPVSKEYVEFKASIPDDMSIFLKWLSKNRYDL